MGNNNMRIGSVVYFKSVKQSTHRTAPELRFNGYGIGLVLGEVPPFQKEPPGLYIFRALGTAGLVRFDDIGEFLGEVAGAEVVKKFQEKYYPMDPNKLDLVKAEFEQHEKAAQAVLESPDGTVLTPTHETPQHEAPPPDQL